MRTIVVWLRQPPTHIRLTGSGAAEIVAELERRYPNLERLADEDSEDWIDVTQTEWYQHRATQMSVGRWLHVYRDNARLTRSRLEAMTGISRQRLARMEHDKLVIDLATARTLAQALNCDYRRLVSS